MYKKFFSVFFSFVVVIFTSFIFVQHVTAADEKEGVGLVSITIDKVLFAAGEVIAPTIVWQPGNSTVLSRAQEQRGSGFTLNVVVTDKEQRFCTEPVFMTLFAENTEVVAPSSAIIDCNDPLIRAILLEDGKIIDAMTVSFFQSENPAADSVSNQIVPVLEKNPRMADSIANVVVFSGIGILFLVSLALITRKRFKKNGRIGVGISVLFFLCMYAFPVNALVLWMTGPPAVTTPSCGTSNGGTFPVAPTTNLCASGLASPVSDTGLSWSWTCAPSYTCVPPSPAPVGLIWYSCTIIGPGVPFSNCSANKPVSPPTISFYPDTYSISAGTSTNLRWTATNATSCTASGAWSGAKAVSGTESTGILSASQVYFLSCTGPGGTSPLYTVPLTVIPVVPTVDLKVNSSDGPVTLASGATKNLSWTATNATSCTASGVDAFTGSKSVPSDSETLTVTRTSTDVLTCTGPGGTTSDSVQVNASCTPSTGAWGSCDCATETKSRTNINASCLPWTESDTCTIDEKNGCRDFNWKEVAP